MGKINKRAKTITLQCVAEGGRVVIHGMEESLGKIS
jgi:hypothetical protein